MKYIIAIFIAFFVLSAYPRKIKQNHLLLKKSVPEVIFYDTIKSSNFIEIIRYEDSIPSGWEVIGPNSRRYFEGCDPSKITVYFNPAAPKFFHAFHDCKKLGVFRKLSETPIDEYLKNNKSAAICPDCNARSDDFYLIVQFLLDD